MEDNALLINIIQLVVLTIPLFFLLPMIKKTSQAAGALGSAADKFARTMGGDKLLDKAQTGMRSNAKKRAAYTGANLSNKLQNEKNFGGYPARALGRAADFRRKRAASGKARELALAGRTASREADIRERMGEDIAAGTSRLAQSVVAVGGASVAGEAARISQEEFNKRVQGIRAQFEISGTGVKEIGDKLADAIKTGDHETATAAIDRLSNMGGGGINQIGETLSQTATTDADMQRTVSNSVNDKNYGALIERAADIAKGGYDSSGQFVGGGVGENGVDRKGSLSGVADSQVARQTAEALHRGAADGSLTQAQAQVITGSQTLMDNTHSPQARKILEDIASGGYTPPPPDPSNPSQTKQRQPFNP